MTFFLPVGNKHVPEESLRPKMCTRDIDFGLFFLDLMYSWYVIFCVSVALECVYVSAQKYH